MSNKREQGAQLHHNLTNHAPINDDVVKAMEAIRRQAKLFGDAIIELAPESREQSLALTNLEQSTMWAIAAIARHQSDD